VRIRVPHTFVLLFLLVVLAAIATHVIPAGEYDRIEKDGRRLVDPGSYQVVAAKLHRRHGLLRAARAAVAASNATLEAMTLPDPPPSGAAGQAAERKVTPRPPRARAGSPGRRTTPDSDL